MRSAAAAAGLVVVLAACADKTNKALPYEATLATASMQGNDYGEAAIHWTNTLAVPDLTPDQRARALLGRSDAYRHQDEIDRALADADASIAVKSDLPEAFAVRGLLHLQKHDYQRAEADFDVALKAKPGLAEAHAGRGDAYRLEGQFDQAISELDAAIAVKPYEGEFYASRGHVYFLEGKDDRALADFDEAVRRAPNNADAYLLRGIAQYETGRLAAAAADFAQCVSLRPKNEFAVIWLHLARLRMKTADADELARNAGNLNLSKWPGPVVAYFLRQSTQDQATQDRAMQDRVLSPAAGHDAETDNGVGCERAFYMAETMMASHKTDAARQMFSTAQQICPAALIEHRLAAAELNAM